MQAGKEKIKKICDSLRKEAIEPAKIEAQEIVEKAHSNAKKIVEEAQEKASQLFQEGKNELENEKKAFSSSMKLACKQSIDVLKQSIEERLFNENLKDIIKEATSSKKVVEKLITAIVESIEEEGIDSDISAYIPKKLSTKEINEMLVEKIIKRLKEKSVVLGNFEGGAQIQLHDDKITLDISDEAIKELVASYVHKDFRDIIFQS